jgi:hypothetical protein
MRGIEYILLRPGETTSCRRRELFLGDLFPDPLDRPGADAVLPGDGTDALPAGTEWCPDSFLNLGINPSGANASL